MIVVFSLTKNKCLKNVRPTKAARQSCLLRSAGMIRSCLQVDVEPTHPYRELWCREQKIVPGLYRVIAVLSERSRPACVGLHQTPSTGFLTSFLLPESDAPSVGLHNTLKLTGPRSAVVSASDCGSEGLGFESHQPWPAPTQSWECYGPSGKGWNYTAELHPLHGCVFEGVALIT